MIYFGIVLLLLNIFVIAYRNFFDDDSFDLGIFFNILYIALTLGYL
jgi:hypothetical protein